MRQPIFVVLLVISFLYACTKISTTDIGSNLIPPIDGVNVKDTFFDVVTNTFIDDDIARIYKGDDHVVGVISNNALFGKTVASAFFELKPTFYPYFIPGNKDSLVVDSAVLVMSYRGLYGDSTIPQTWRVFEIDKASKLRYDTAYGAQNTNISFSNLLGTGNSLNLTTFDDSVNYGFENAKNQIRIRLNSTFATRLMKNYDSSNVYRNDSIFRENFAGFAVVPDQGMGNALIRINLLDTNTKLSLYYSTRLASAEKRDTTVAYFRFNSAGGATTSANANIIRRDRSGAQVTTYLHSNTNDSLAFVQTSPGTFVTIKIPNLSRFRNVLVYRAELEAVQAPFNTYTDETLGPPRYLLLSGYDSVNKRKTNVPNDYEISSGGASNIGAFGGFRRTRTVNGSTISYYNFNLTRYVQGIVTRKDSSRTLRLSAPSNDSLYYTPPYPISSSAGIISYIMPNTANPIAVGDVRIFGGGGRTDRRMRLRIIYSEVQ